MNLITDSFTYAFRESGKYMLIIGAFLSVISALASWAPLFGSLAYLFLSSYFCSTYFRIIRSTAVGGSEAPSFPDVSNIMEDLIWPFFKVLLVCIISFLPYIAYTYLVGPQDNLILNTLAILGLIYLPMAILAVVVLGHLGAASPLLVIPSIIRAGGLYWLAVVLLVLIYFLLGLLEIVLGNNIIVTTLILGLVGMYVLMTSGRILGLVYKNREEELGWF